MTRNTERWREILGAYPRIVTGMVLGIAILLLTDLGLAYKRVQYGWELARMRSAMMRAATSVEPPGGNGTTKVSWRVGKLCACAYGTAMAAIAASTAAATTFFICLPQIAWRHSRQLQR